MKKHTVIIDEGGGIETLLLDLGLAGFINVRTCLCGARFVPVSLDQVRCSVACAEAKASEEATA